jgi:prepilin-type N-terminal cleavage/methylation domain-containing protein/prepilin-type processing-associated H-X9-DG protein
MKRYGFTLIELLVVIAVIAVLMGILMPALNRARDQGRKIVCSNNLHSLVIANGVYASTFNDWNVPCQDASNTGHTVWTANTAYRAYIGYKGSEDTADQSTVQTPKKFRCPSDRQRPDEHAYNVEQGSTGGTLVSYGYNIEDWFPSRGAGSWTGRADYLGYKASTIKQPALKLHFNEGHDWWSAWHGANFIDGWDVLGQMGTVNEYKAAGCGGPTMYRHNGQANFAFYDGHVASLHKEKVWVPEAFNTEPYNPGMWAVKREVWQKNAGL